MPADSPRYKRLKGAGGQSDPFIVHAPTMTELWNHLNDEILWASEDELAYFSSLDAMVGDAIGIADTAEFTFDIGADIWVTPTRWTTLLNQYVDPERLFRWLERVKEMSTYNRGIIAMDFNTVKHQVVESNKRASRRKSGACMRMITYRSFPQPTISLYSRTSYLGYIGGLDMLLAHKLTELAADMIGDGLKVEDFQFRWHCEAFQVHGFKSMAYIFGSGQDKFMRMSPKKWASLVGRRVLINGVPREIRPLDEMPTWKLIRYWWARIQRQDDEGKLYQDMKYGAEKRIRRRYHAQTGIDQTPYLGDREKEYKPLSTPMELITLDRMLYRTPESRAVIRKQKLEKAQALIDLLFADDDTDILALENAI
jgi:hypothetical protein